MLITGRWIVKTDPGSILQRISGKLQRTWISWEQNRKVARISSALRNYAGEPEGQPVVFFNASTRLVGLSQNAAFSLIASWGVAAAGVPVVYYVCRSGMDQCVLGSVVGEPLGPMPCEGCIQQSERLTRIGETAWLEYDHDQELIRLTAGCSLDELKHFNYLGLPLGELVLPSLRWVLRRHHLIENQLTLAMYRKMILSASRIARDFRLVLEEHDPRGVVIFNGLQFPEAVVKWVSRQQSVRVITHEVSYRPLSGFFTAGEATEYPIAIPDSFELSPAQNHRLDAYLDKRFQGDFTMAGIQFWSEMETQNPELDTLQDKFKQMVVVFTNVCFDTSQAKANVIFESMFAWLEEVFQLARSNPDTLFVIRAHPDEAREGKHSQETVEDFVTAQTSPEDENVFFLGPRQSYSSYELIRKAKFSLVYNSSIGLEASILGEPVLCGGKARYTQYPIVFFPETAEAYREKAQDLLDTEEIEVPADFQDNARRFMYYQLFKVSLPFDDFLVDHPLPGYVRLRDFSVEELTPERSRTISTLVEGIVSGKDFVLGETESSQLKN